ncbi:DinB family protein [Paeniroseomonas aquatica]|uniref:DinB family protein n=1 Tax=Paeniroseomonas aquatica TaxID=373043 RepID=UPI00361E2529
MTILDTRLAAAPAASLAGRYAALRNRTERLAAPLSPEDQTIQSMPDASPTKWHRAHMTWFFETFLLLPYQPGYRRFREEFGFLFNSYYEAAGPRHARPKRGMLTRPSAAEVGAYRAHVDAAMDRLLRDPPAEALPLIELGLQHEQQHQELLLTDILHALSQNPLLPAYDADWRDPAASPAWPG